MPPPPTWNKIPILLKKAVEWIPKIFSFVSNMLGNRDKVAKQEVYNEDNPLDEQNKIFSAISEYKRDMIEKSEQLEDTLLDSVEEIYSPLIEFLKDCGIQTKAITKLISDNNRKISGILKGEISQTFSTSNPKCLEILKMPSGAGKDEAMKYFEIDMLSHALELIKEEIEDSANFAFESISDLIFNKIESQENLIKANLSNLNEMLEADRLDSKELGQINLASNIAIESYTIDFMEYNDVRG